MEPFDDTDGWTRVSRRRNRARDERRRSPQPTSFPGEHRQQHTRRSYASVAREGQRSHLQRPRNPNWVQSDDPAFTHKVRIIYKIIKSNHHLKNVSGKHPPPSIRKNTSYLIDLIKPAFPNEITHSLLEGNAKNWEYTTMLILRQHYEDIMNQEIQDLAEFPTREWEGPFRVASAWATRNLGPRLKTETLDDTKAFLKANLNEHVPPETEGDLTAAETDPAPAAVPTTPRSTLQAVQALLPPTPPPLSPLPPRSCPLPLFTSPTSQARDAEPQPGTAEAQGETETMAARVPPALPLRPRNAHNLCVCLQAENDTESGSSHPSRGRSATATLRFTPISAGATSETRGARLLRPRRLRGRGTTTAAAEELSDPLQFTTSTRRPTTHVNTDRKLQDWGLGVNKKQLIIGNNRKQKTQITTAQLLRRAAKMARDNFPQDAIRVPIIH